jgi:hypothetical protein
MIFGRYIEAAVGPQPVQAVAQAVPERDDASRRVRATPQA